MKVWFVLGFIALVAGVLVHGTSLRTPVDAHLLDALASSSQWWESTDGTEAASPSHNWRLDLIVRAHEFGGLRLANWVRNFFPVPFTWLVLGVIWLSAIFLSFWRPSWRRRLQKSLAVFLGLLCLWGIWTVFRPLPPGPLAAELRLPAVLLELVSAAKDIAGAESTVWASPSALRHLSVLDTGLPVDRSESALQAAVQPSLWREMDREKRYGAVLFYGPAAEYQPLLLHLLESPDWQLESVLGYGVVFSRGASDLASPLPVVRDSGRQFGHPRDRAVYLARMASQLSMLEQYGAARRFFRRALEVAPERPDIRALHANFLALRQQWGEAAAEARQILQDFPSYIPALQVLIQAEIALGETENAWREAQRLRRLQPDDVFSVFLFAKAANSAGVVWAEAEALEKLILLAGRQGLPTAPYRIFLGQAFARQGYGKMALEQFEMALASGLLPPGQVAQVEELIETIREKTGNF